MHERKVLVPGFLVYTRLRLVYIAPMYVSAFEDVTGGFIMKRCYCQTFTSVMLYVDTLNPNEVTER